MRYLLVNIQCPDFMSRLRRGDSFPKMDIWSVPHADVSVSHWPARKQCVKCLRSLPCIRNISVSDLVITNALYIWLRQSYLISNGNCCNNILLAHHKQLSLTSKSHCVKSEVQKLCMLWMKRLFLNIQSYNSPWGSNNSPHNLHIPGMLFQ